MSKVGLIAHPFSGKDVRRLVGYAWVVSNQEKIAIIRRLLCGLAEAGVEQVLYMPEPGGLYQQAFEALGSNKLRGQPVDIPLTFSQADSTAAAKVMAEQDVPIIITLGGDGTNRAVFKGCGPEVVLLPISTGTNNVFPQFQEGTMAGYAAGLFATGRVSRDGVTWRSKVLHVEPEEGLKDLALIDLAVVNNQAIGSKAIWEVSALEKLFLTRAEPWNIGLSAIGGALQYIPATGSKNGMQLEFGPGGQPVKAAIVPGQFSLVSVLAHHLLTINEKIQLKFDHKVTLAFDGERDLALRPGQAAVIELAANGPAVLDIQQTLLQSLPGQPANIQVQV